MAIGPVWKPGGTGRQVYASATGPVAQDVTPVSVVDPVPFVEWRWPELLAVETNVNGTLLPVATLAAPPAGYQHVIERITIIAPLDGTTTEATVRVGGLAATKTVDRVPTPLGAMVATDPQPIRVPANSPLYVVFTGTSTPADCTVNLQVRVEQVA